MDRLYYEDFPPGETVEYGDTHVTAEAIVEFARQFDPQPFHLDEKAGRASMAGGLIASGWHTTAMMMRMNCDGFLLRSASQGGPGVEEVKWLKPVRPGDRLRVRRSTLSSRLSRSRPSIGIVDFLFELFNGSGEIVMTQKNSMLILRRSEAVEAK
jgi:acyl dehydratase